MEDIIHQKAVHHQSGVPAPTAGICHQKLRGIAVAGTQKIATLK